MDPSSCFFSADHWSEVLGRREKQGSSLADCGCLAEAGIKTLNQRWRVHISSTLCYVNLPAEPQVTSESHTRSLCGARCAYISTGQEDTELGQWGV